MTVVDSICQQGESVSCGLSCCHQGCAGSDVYGSLFLDLFLCAVSDGKCFLPLSRWNLNNHSNNWLELRIYAFEACPRRMNELGSLIPSRAREKHRNQTDITHTIGPFQAGASRQIRYTVIKQDIHHAIV